ncbi:MAG: TetR family transcriptional regulator [Pseudonocardiales bacterium]|nr:MAG: TetR family transcriptional regulator [Pseudonocardiales bacterium]
MIAAPIAAPIATQRRRGVALEDAILEAAYAELTEVGYSRFSVEAVAARARTGKASIYRRWATKQALVLDALCSGLPTAQECGFEQGDCTNIYQDLTTTDALRQVARVITNMLTSPAGAAMRAVKLEAITDPELAREIDDRFQAPRRAAMLSLLRRGVERGEVRPDAVTPLIADVLPAVLMHRVILQRERITERDITAIIEQILIPLVEVR